MENKKTKNHKENWIGNIIRGFLLFMPLIAIGVTCAYAIFNKNAYQSYAGENEGHSRITLLTNINEMKVDNSYRFDSRNFDLKDTTTPQNDYAHYIFYTETKNIETNTIYNTSAMLQNKLALYIGSNNVFSVKNQDNAVAYFSGTNYLVFDFYYSNSTLVYNFAYNNIFATIEYNSYSFVSEVFYYSIDKVQQSPLFNWAENTGMYNVIHGACNTLGIESTFVSFLLAYWLLTYLIYIIYDIALLIVNMAHNRIHDVESSI